MSHEIVACRAADGSILHRSRQAAESWGLPIIEGRPATDGHGKPLPDKIHITIKPASPTSPITPAEPTTEQEEDDQ